MGAFKFKLISILISFGLISGAGIGALLYYVFPQFCPDLNWYAGTVFFFLTLEVLLMGFIISKSETSTSKKMVNVYMLAKVVKMLLSLVFVAVYVLVVKTNVTNFVLVFIVFYMLYLFIETFLFSKLEQQLKGKNNS